MSIRLIAKDLYRLICEVQRLEKALDAAPVQDREAIATALGQTRAQRDHLRRILEGRKNQHPP